MEWGVIAGGDFHVVQPAVVVDGVPNNALAPVHPLGDVDPHPGPVAQATRLAGQYLVEKRVSTLASASVNRLSMMSGGAVRVFVVVAMVVLLGSGVFYPPRVM
jgi:hypothetical protein